MITIIDVEQIAFERAAIKDVFKERSPIGIFDFNVLPQAFVQPPNCAKHRKISLGHVERPVGERDLREVFILLIRINDRLGVLVILFDRQKQPVLLERQCIKFYLDIVVSGQGILEVEDVWNDGIFRSITYPAIVLVLQQRTVINRHHPEDLGDVACKLKMQHLVNEYAEEMIERHGV